jgi:YbgC/YbaW family acyl-CoA thioester hydrolase
MEIDMATRDTVIQLLRTGSALEKEPESRMRIRFQDCDPFRHLNSAQYLDYFMNARDDQLRRHYAFDLDAYAKEDGGGWVVATYQNAYLLPALVAEEVLIRTRIVKGGPRGMVLEALMFDSQGETLKAVSWCEFAFVNVATGRPMKHTEFFLELLDAIMYREDEPETEDFKARVGQIRRIERHKRRVA